MTVYVDGLVAWGFRIRGRTVKTCHMTADTDAELHEMASRIGMKRQWAQHLDDDNQYRRHYDLVESRRRRAVAAGAVEIDHRQYAKMLKAERARNQGRG